MRCVRSRFSWLALLASTSAVIGCASVDKPSETQSMLPPAYESQEPPWNPPAVVTKMIRGNRYTTFRYDDNQVYDVYVGPPGTLVTLRFGPDEIIPSRNDDRPLSDGSPQPASNIMVRQVGGRSVAAVTIPNSKEKEMTTAFLSGSRIYQVNFRRASKKEPRTHVVDWDYSPESRHAVAVAQSCSMTVRR